MYLVGDTFQGNFKNLSIRIKFILVNLRQSKFCTQHLAKAIPFLFAHFWTTAIGNVLESIRFLCFSQMKLIKLLNAEESREWKSLIRRLLDARMLLRTTISKWAKYDEKFWKLVTKNSLLYIKNIVVFLTSRNETKKSKRLDWCSSSSSCRAPSQHIQKQVLLRLNKNSCHQQYLHKNLRNKSYFCQLNKSAFVPSLYKSCF